MLITRAKATALLNQKEMELYTDSRVNTLRQLDAKALTTRVGTQHYLYELVTLELRLSKACAVTR